MANYDSVTRTNYFRVKDENRFREIMEKDYIDFWEQDTYFAFGDYGSIGDDLYEELQEVVADDDAIIIMEVGHEKLRYVTGLCTVITHDEIAYVNMIDKAEELARDMLKNPDFNPDIEY